MAVADGCDTAERGMAAPDPRTEKVEKIGDPTGDISENLVIYGDIYGDMWICMYVCIYIYMNIRG